jgi:hypothetical protein
MADLSKYAEVRTLQFTHSEHDLLRELNDLLADGWEIIDARVTQWGHVERE